MNTRDKLQLMTDIKARNEARLKQYMEDTGTKMCYLVEKSVDEEWPKDTDHLVIREMKVALIMANAMWVQAKQNPKAHVTVMEAKDAEQTRTIWRDGAFEKQAYMGGDPE